LQNEQSPVTKTVKIDRRQGKTLEIIKTSWGKTRANLARRKYQNEILGTKTKNQIPLLGGLGQQIMAWEEIGLQGPVEKKRLVLERLQKNKRADAKRAVKKQREAAEGRR